MVVQVTSSALEAVRQIKAESQDLLVRIGAIRQVLLDQLTHVQPDDDQKILASKAVYPVL